MENKLECSITDLNLHRDNNRFNIPGLIKNWMAHITLQGAAEMSKIK